MKSLKIGTPGIIVAYTFEGPSNVQIQMSELIFGHFCWNRKKTVKTDKSALKSSSEKATEGNCCIARARLRFQVGLSSIEL